MTSSKKNKPNPRFLEALELRAEGQIEGALLALTEAGKVTPLWATLAHTARASIYCGLGDTARAEEEYRLGLSITPGVKKTSYLLFNFLIQQGRLEEAIEHGKNFFSNRTSDKVDGLIIDWKLQLKSLEDHAEAGKLPVLRQKALEKDWAAPKEPCVLFANSSAISSFFEGTPDEMCSTLSLEFGLHLLEEERGTSYYSWLHAGVSVLVENERVVCVFLYNEGEDDFCRFLGPLPSGLEFENSQAQVTALLGAPHRIGKGRDLTWLAYDWPEYSYHLTYSADGNSISMATITRPG